jgi:hypothetical protein
MGSGERYKDSITAAAGQLHSGMGMAQNRRDMSCIAHQSLPARHYGTTRLRPPACLGMARRAEPHGAERTQAEFGNDISNSYYIINTGELKKHLLYTAIL